MITEDILCNKKIKERRSFKIAEIIAIFYAIYVKFKDDLTDITVNSNIITLTICELIDLELKAGMQTNAMQAIFDKFDLLYDAIKHKNLEDGDEADGEIDGQIDDDHDYNSPDDNNDDLNMLDYDDEPKIINKKNKLIINGKIIVKGKNVAKK